MRLEFCKSMEGNFCKLVLWRMGFLDMATVSSFILLFFNFVFLCCWGQGYILVIEKIVCVWHIPFFFI